MIFTLRQPNVEATLEEVERARIAVHVEVCHTTLSARGPDGVWERLHPSAVIHAIARPMVTRREEQVAHEPLASSAVPVRPCSGNMRKHISNHPTRSHRGRVELVCNEEPVGAFTIVCAVWTGVGKRPPQIAKTTIPSLLPRE